MSADAGLSRRETGSQRAAEVQADRPSVARELPRLQRGILWVCNSDGRSSRFLLDRSTVRSRSRPPHKSCTVDVIMATCQASNLVLEIRLLYGAPKTKQTNTMNRPIQKATRKNYLIHGLLALFFGHRLRSEDEDVKKAAEEEAKAFALRTNRMSIPALERLHPANRAGDSLMFKRSCAGTGPRLRRSRSRYSPVVEDHKHGLIPELPAHLA